MSTHSYAPVQRVIEKLRALSVDEEARYWAEAREEGEQIGLQQSRREQAHNFSGSAS